MMRRTSVCRALLMAASCACWSVQSEQVLKTQLLDIDCASPCFDKEDVEVSTKLATAAASSASGDSVDMLNVDKACVMKVVQELNNKMQGHADNMEAKLLPNIFEDVVDASAERVKGLKKLLRVEITNLEKLLAKDLKAVSAASRKRLSAKRKLQAFEEYEFLENLDAVHHRPVAKNRDSLRKNFAKTYISKVKASEGDEMAALFIAQLKVYLGTGSMTCPLIRSAVKMEKLSEKMYDNFCEALMEKCMTTMACSSHDIDHFKDDWARIDFITDSVNNLVEE